MSNSKIVIAEQGLIKVSKELINKRTYSEDLITIEGSPFVLDGVASGVDGSNYFLHSGLDLTDTTNLKIKFKGKYSSPDSEGLEQCAWSFQDSQYNILSLQLSEEAIKIYKNDTEIVEVKDIIYSPEELVNIVVDLTNTTYKIILIKDDEYSIYEGDLEEEIDVTLYTSLKIGVLSHGSLIHWCGSIELADFIVYKDNEIYYAPSVDPTFNFTKILVSDGTIELQDNSAPVLNHIYEFPVSEIQRTGGNVLIVSQIGGSAHLNISTIGLYTTGDDGTKLFATIDGLSIKKTSELGYDLVFTVKLNLGVVNTVALPEIVIVEEDHPVKRDFLTIERVYAYLITNLERCIFLNATELGRERDYNVFKLENEYELQQANYNSSKIFADIKKRIHETETVTFDSSKIIKTGAPIVTTDGQASNFSTSNYIKLKDAAGDAKTWEFKTVFTSNQITGATQTVASFSSSSQELPLVIGITSNNRCYVELNKLESIDVLNTSLSTSSNKFNRAPNYDSSTSSAAYYAWKNEFESQWVNTHATTVGEVINENGIMSSFTTSNYAYATYTNDSRVEDGFVFTLPFTTSTIGTKQGLISSTTGNYYIDVTMGTDGKLQYNFGDGTQWLVATGSETGTTTLTASTNYVLKIDFDGTDIIAYLSTDAGGTYTQDWSYSLTSSLSPCAYKFGVNNSSEAWVGSINFNSASMIIGSLTELETIWTGTCQSSLIYTQALNPTTSSNLYDVDYYPYNYSSISSTDKGELINETLFIPNIGVKYYIAVSYDGSSYTISYSTDGDYYIRAYEYETSTHINYIGGVYFGISEELLAVSNPFTGMIHLRETEFILNGTDYSPSNTVYDNKCLKDFYTFIDPKRSIYYITNLSGKNYSKIRMVENNIEGDQDDIDFNSSEGFSLCIKADLKDSVDKVLLTKMNLEEDEKYFVLKFEDDSLVFELYTENNIVVLSQEYTLETISTVLTVPILVSVTYDGLSLKLYVNSELKKTITGTITGFLEASNYSLYNVSDPDDYAEINYIEGIASFNGVLTADDIHYLTNVTSSGY